MIAPVPTEMGVFTAEYSENGLCRLRFPRGKKLSIGPALTKQQQSWHRKTQTAVQAILIGRAPRTLPPLDFSNGTDFRRRVWEMLLTIPAGARVFRLLPPLNISKQDADEGLAIIESVIKELAS